MGRKKKSASQTKNDNMAEIDSVLKQVDAFVYSHDALTIDPKDALIAIDRLSKDINALQLDHGKPAHAFTNDLTEFIAWLKKGGAMKGGESDGFKIASTGSSEGRGIYATRELKQFDEVLSIPQDLMITENTILDNSILKQFITHDKLLNQNKQLALVFGLFIEYLNPKSKFGPYIRTLPDSYSMPIYWSSIEEVMMLAGSPAILNRTVSMQLNQLRNYSYIWKLIKSKGNRISSALKLSDFTLSSFLWAYGAVSSRQNMIPVSTEERGVKDVKQVLALIPLWDMFNHAQGEITTDFDLKSKSIISFAMKDYKIGDQMFIFYGQRPNSDLLLFQGFVDEKNVYDKYDLPSLVDPDDKYSKIREMILNKYPSVVYGKIELRADGTPSDGLISYLRVQSMSKAELTQCLKLSMLKSTDSVEFKSKENDSASAALLLGRCNEALLCQAGVKMEDCNDLTKSYYRTEVRLLRKAIELCEKIISGGEEERFITSKK